MLNKLLKLANKLDEIEQYKIANEIDALFKVAAKIDTLKEKYPNYMFEIDKLNDADPTPTKKYLEWAAKQISTGLYTTHEVAAVIKQFHLHNQKIENKDINSYKTLEDVEKALVGKDLPSKRQLKEVAKSGADVVYDSPNYVAIHPKTKDAVCTYGAGTKWCITMKDQDHFENYSNRGIVFYYILDRHPKDEVMNKVAIALNVMAGSGIFEIFDAQDRQIDVKTLADYYGNEWSAIESAIKSHSKAEGMSSAQDYMMGVALNGTSDQKLELAQQENLPPNILEALAKSDDYDIKAAIAGNTNTPIHVLDSLANTSDFYLAKPLVSNPSITAEILRKLLNNKISGSDEDMWVIREKLANNPKTPSDILDMLVRFGQMFIDKSVSMNPNISLEAANTLLDRHGHGPLVSFMASSSQNPDILNLLFKESFKLDDIYTYDWKTDAGSANGPEIRKLIARNPNTPLELVIKLAQDKLVEVRGAAYITNRIPADIFTTLMQKEDTGKKAEIAFGDNPIYIEILSHDPNVYIRAVVAMNVDAPRDVLQRLMHDEDQRVVNNAKETLETLNAKQSSLKHKIRKLAQQLENLYYPLGQKGDEYGDNADQESTVPEEINDEMEAVDMDGKTPGMDNVIIDKNNNPGDAFDIFANLKDNAILLKCRISKRIGIQ